MKHDLALLAIGICWGVIGGLAIRSFFADILFTHWQKKGRVQVTEVMGGTLFFVKDEVEKPNQPAE